MAPDRLRDHVPQRVRRRGSWPQQSVFLWAVRGDRTAARRRRRSALRLRGSGAYGASRGRASPDSRGPFPLRTGRSEDPREEGRSAEGNGRGRPFSAHALLLTDHGARRRHLGDERRLHAQRAADARQLRAAERTCGTQRASRVYRRLLRRPEPPRPVFLSPAEGNGRRRGPPTVDRSDQSRSRREPLACGVAGGERRRPEFVDRPEPRHDRARQAAAARALEAGFFGRVETRWHQEHLCRPRDRSPRTSRPSHRPGSRTRRPMRRRWS